MSQVNVFEVKAKFAEYLDRAAHGERIVIYRYNKPVAELRPIASVRIEPRSIGPVEGRPTFDVPPSFFEPLDEDELKAWEGLPDAAALAADSVPPADTKPRQARKRRP